MKITKVLDLMANLPSNIKFTGIEIEYTTAPGTVLLGAISASQSGKHTYPVPLMDPQRMPSSAGGFPWKADGGYNTIVYIKNETDIARKYTVSLLFDGGGGYSHGVRELKPKETVAIDFKKLRDEQTEDVNGNTIPLNIETGQIAWSSKGPDNRTTSGRSEQVNETLGIASTYACYNECMDSFDFGWVDPGGASIWQGQSVLLTAYQQDKNHYGGSLPPYPALSAMWSSNAPYVASVSPLGEAYGVSGGGAVIEATWLVMKPSESEACHYYQDLALETASISVTPITVEINGPSSAQDGDTVNFSSSVTGATPTAYQWSFTAPSGAGNDPQVDFSSTTTASTSFKAHWFAYPNSDCATEPPPASGSHPYYNSIYTITLKVTFSNNIEIIQQKNFTVNAWWYPAGRVGEPELTGTITTTESPAGHFTVTGHSLTRVTQPATINVSGTSQFYDKTVAHENVHVPQYHTGNLLGNYFTVNGFWTYLQSLNLSSSTHGGLMMQVAAARDSYYQSQAVAMINSGDYATAEIAAYNVSDPLTPMFAYQRCGRTFLP